MYIRVGTFYTNIIQILNFYLRKYIEFFKVFTFSEIFWRIYLKTFEHTFSEIFWRIYQKTFGHTFPEIFWRIYQKTFGHTFSENFWAYIFGNILKNLSENFWAALRAAQNFSEIRIFSKTILLTFLPNRYRYFTPVMNSYVLAFKNGPKLWECNFPWFFYFQKKRCLQTQIQQTKIAVTKIELSF